MRKFLKLNRSKIKFAFKISSSIFLTIVLIVLIILYFKGNLPDLNLIISIMFVAGVLFPCFIIFIAFLSWSYKQWASRRVFSKPPFNQLHELGFADGLQAEKSKWAFTEEVKIGKINKFDFIMDVLYDKRHIIETRVFPAWKQMDKDEFRKISAELEKYHIEFDVFSLVKRYNTKKRHLLTLDQLRMDLEKFTEVLRQNGFEPQKNSS